MFTSIHTNFEPFASCEKKCEECAEEASSLTPDRRLFMSCRYAGEWCRKVVDEIRAEKLSGETLLSCARACERCDEMCRGSILACCRVCAAECAYTSRVCYQVAMSGLKRAA